MRARFNSLFEKELFWSVYADGELLRWVGYDHAFWWEHVAPTEFFRARTTKLGNTYMLNPATSEVVLVEAANV